MGGREGGKKKPLKAAKKQGKIFVGLSSVFFFQTSPLMIMVLFSMNYVETEI